MSADTKGRRVVIHTDGSCKGNPGPGGWAAILSSYDGNRLVKQKELTGGEAQTTNNRMEMTAAINALRQIKPKARPVIIISDSQLLVRGMTEWLPGWKAKGWRKYKGGAVENADLWKELDQLSTLHHIEWQWIGRASDTQNERADSLAKKEAALAGAMKRPTRFGRLTSDTLAKVELEQDGAL